MNLETKITIYKFTPQVFTLTRNPAYVIDVKYKNVIYVESYYCFSGCRSSRSLYRSLYR